MVERIPITDRASWLAMRQQDVTASAVGALLGVHEFTTPYALWALKTGRVQEDAAETGPMRRGRLLERVAIDALREERPTWVVEPGTAYYRDPADRLGATPDVLVQDPERGPGIVQIKSVEPGVFRRKWFDDAGEVEPPLWIAVQAITEAYLTGSSWASIATLVVGYDIELRLIDVPVHAGVIERVRGAVREFWAMVDSGREPDPDWNRDAGLATRFATLTDEALDLSASNSLPGLLDRRARRKAYIKLATEQCEAIDAEIREAVGAAKLATLPGWKIACKPVETKPYQIAGRTTRPLRITRTRGEAA